MIGHLGSCFAVSTISPELAFLAGGGKLADIILLDGDPLEGYWNWLKTKVVIKGGVKVVDKR